MSANRLSSSRHNQGTGSLFPENVGRCEDSRDGRKPRRFRSNEKLRLTGASDICEIEVDIEITIMPRDGERCDEKERHGRSKPAPIPEQAELSAPEQEQSHDGER